MANRALELISKRLGMFVQLREFSGPHARPIEIINRSMERYSDAQRYCCCRLLMGKRGKMVQRWTMQLSAVTAPR